MTIYEIRIKRAVLTALLLLLTLAGCAGQNNVKEQNSVKVSEVQSVKEGRIVQAGDSVDLHYVCRLNNGEVVAATDSVAKDQPKSNLYLVREETGPLSITAVSPDGPEPDGAKKTFDELIQGKLARIVAGMKEGDKRQAELTAMDIKGKNTSRLARVRIRPKEMEVPLGDLKYRTGKSPEVGDFYAYDPDFPGRVVALKEKTAVVRFSAKPGEVIKTPFGPGLIREDEKNYYIDIDARKNALFRAGDLVGRIVDVDDKFFIVDFSNPFAGEKLFCDLTVEKITAANPIKSEAGK